MLRLIKPFWINNTLKTCKFFSKPPNGFGNFDRKR